MPIARAGCCQSSRPSSRVSLGARLMSPCCGTAVALPASTAERVWASSTAPLCDSRSSSSPAVSAGRTASVRVPKTGPVSRPSSSRKVTAPVRSSPAMSGALHGRRTAPGRKQGEVQVDPAVPGQLEGRARNQPAVGDDGGHVGRGSRDPGGHRGVDLGGVDDLDAELRGPDGHRRRREHALAAQRGVRPGQDSDDVEAGCDEGVQRGHGDGRGSREEDPHWPVPKAVHQPAPPKLEPTVLARFAVVCSVMAS